MKKPLFALLIPNLSVGGIQRVILNLGISLQRKGAEVHLLLIKGEGELLKEVPDSIKVINFNLTSIFRLPPRLIRYLKKYRPTALLSTHPNMNLAVSLSKKVSGVNSRIVVSEHNDPLSASKFRKSKRRFSAAPFLKKLIYPWADAIVGISEGVADGIAKSAGIPRDRIQVIYNPIVSDRIRNLAKEKLTWPKGEEEERVKLVAVGRLGPQKDFSTLLEALNVFRKRMPAQLVILGEGEQRKRLEAEIRNQGLEGIVHLLGYVQNPYAYMSAADIFVSSSLWEGLPTVHVEALACGCQVVSTDCPSGPSEILAGGRYGRLVPVKDPQALADAIEQTVENPLPKDVLRKRAEYFSVERSVEQYWRVLIGEV